jgi:two-component system response regulator DesR
VIRLLLVEDQAMFRSAVAQLLELEEDLEVVAEVADGTEAVQAALRARPDVALVDIELPGCSGLEIAAELRDQLPACGVVMVTTFRRPGFLRRAMEAGAAGFVLKDTPASELAAVVRRVQRGEQVVDPELAIEALRDGESPLTAREHEVLVACRDHSTVTAMAAALHLSDGTVRNHLSAIIGKLGVRTRVEALSVAEQKGWL